MLTERERALIEKKLGAINMMVKILREHFRQGVQGFVKDGQMNVQPWGFRLEDIALEAVRFYYGADDVNTPARMGREMAAKLKSAVFNEYEGETHITLAENHGEDIMRDMMKH